MDRRFLDAKPLIPIEVYEPATVETLQSDTFHGKQHILAEIRFANRKAGDSAAKPHSLWKFEPCDCQIPVRFLLSGIYFVKQGVSRSPDNHPSRGEQACRVQIDRVVKCSFQVCRAGAARAEYTLKSHRKTSATTRFVMNTHRQPSYTSLLNPAPAPPLPSRDSPPHQKPASLSPLPPPSAPST